MNTDVGKKRINTDLKRKERTLMLERKSEQRGNTDVWGEKSEH